MIRAACLRAFALVLLAAAGGWSVSAQAEQSEPASKTKQADSPAAPAPAASNQPQTTPTPGSPNAPQAPATGTQAPANTGPQTPPANGPQTPAVPASPSGQALSPGVTNPTPTKPTLAGDPIQTPAQQRYGVPRNPILGGPVDFDLTRPLTLERAVLIGLLRQNTIAVAQTQTEVARGSLIQARASYYPQVNPSFQYQSNVSPGSGTFVGSGANTTTGGTTGTTTGTSRKARRTRQSGDPSGTGSGLTPGQSSGGTGTGTGVTTGTGTGTGTGTTFVSGSNTSESRTEVVAVSQLIYDSGKREANVGLARRNVFASEYGLGDARQSVVLNVTESYYNLQRDRELVRVQEENVRLAQTTLDAINAQVQAGAAAKTDTFQAESNLANARINLLSAQNDVRNAESTLKNAMGVVASQPLVLSDTTVPPPNPTPDTQTVENYMQTAYNYRLDLKQQQENIYAQGYNVRIAHINNGVQVNASVTEGYQTSPDSGEERSFVVAFSYPLFDAGSTRAAVRATKAQQEAARRNLDALEQNVRLDLEQSYNTRELARLRVGAANIAVQAGQINFQAAEEKQRNGVINILDVLNAQVQLVTAQVAQVQAVYDFYIADARLRRDMGQNDPGYVPDIPGNRAPKRQFTRK
jgi:outer membrane protein